MEDKVENVEEPRTVGNQSAAMVECTKSLGFKQDIEVNGSNDRRLRIMEKYATRPGACFCAACGVHCFLVLLFLIGNLAGKKRFMNVQSHVALHLWDNEWKIRADALTQGKEECDYDGVGSTIQKQQTMHQISEGYGEYSLELVFEARNGNMMTPGNLAKAKELEDFVLSHSSYTSHCLQEDQSCVSHASPILACTPTLCGYYQNSQGLGVQSGCGAVNADGQTPASDCSPQKSWPPGVYQCESTACDRSTMTLTQDFLTAKLKQFTSATFAVDYPETLFLASVDSSFGSGATTAAAIKSVFKFGFPLAGYTSTADRKKEQVEKTEKFMKDAFFEKLEEWNSEQGDNPVVSMGYVGGTLADDSIAKLLNGDFALVGMAFFVVGAYMVFMTQSYFLTSLAMTQILVCFLAGFMVYRVLYNSFFGSFHIMALFLLLGVGVDDVFVMIDHFTAAALVDKDYKDDLWSRISWTWKHATIAMGVTSSTTVIAFVMNATSSFPGIQAFGLFAGSLVLCLYLSMCFYYVAVVCYNYDRFRDTPFCCGIAEKLNNTMERTLTGKSRSDIDAAALVEGADGPERTEDESSKGALVSFFENHFARFILFNRLKIVVLFLGVSIVMCIQLGKLTPEKTVPKMLPEDHPIEQYTKIMKERFVRGGGVFNTKVKLVFGFDRNIIDRDGTDPIGEANGEEDPKNKLGKVRWNPTWNDPWPNAQGSKEAAFLRGSDCAVHLCNEAEKVDAARNTGGAPAYSMEGCWQRDIKLQLMSSYPNDWASYWSEILAGNGTTFFWAIDLKSKATPGWYEKTGQSVFAQADPAGSAAPVLKFFVYELRLTSSVDMDFKEGNKLADAWKSWMDTQLASQVCSSVSETFYGFVHADDFHQFKIVETLISEMTTSVITSILVALAVLILATGNIIVGSIAGLSIGMIVLWVLAMIPTFGWELGMVENLTLVMVPGLSVDYVAHLAEAFNQAKYDDREHRVIHCLEHSGVSIVSGAISTVLAGLCLMLCKIIFFKKFGTLLLCTIAFSVLFSLFFFPALMSLIGPTGVQGDWHHLIAPCLHHEQSVEKNFDTIKPTKRASMDSAARRASAKTSRQAKE